MEEEKIPQTKEQGRDINLKFSFWFYIAIALGILIFVIVSAVTKEVCYWAAALSFATLFAEFLRLSLKIKSVLLIIVAAVSFAAFALMLTLWIMKLCGLG